MELFLSSATLQQVECCVNSHLRPNPLHGHPRGRVIFLAVSPTRVWDATCTGGVTLELKYPGKHLDAYLRPFKSGVGAQATLLDSLKALWGLDGKDAVSDQNIAYRGDDQKAIEIYLESR